MPGQRAAPVRARRPRRRAVSAGCGGLRKSVPPKPCSRVPARTGRRPGRRYRRRGVSGVSGVTRRHRSRGRVSGRVPLQLPLRMSLARRTAHPSSDSTPASGHAEVLSAEVRDSGHCLHDGTLGRAPGGSTVRAVPSERPVSQARRPAAVPCTRGPGPAPMPCPEGSSSALIRMDGMAGLPLNSRTISRSSRMTKTAGQSAGGLGSVHDPRRGAWRRDR